MDTAATAETTPVEVNEPQETTSQVKLDKGDFVLEQEEFSRGITKGLKYWFKSYKSVDGAIKHLDSLNKDTSTNGEQIVLGLLNNAVKSALRGRANSKIPQQEDNDTDGAIRKGTIQSLIANGKETLVDEITAENYVPGTREKTSIPALWKEYQTIKDKYAELKKAGKFDDAEEVKTEGLAIRQRIDALMLADESLDNL